MNKDVVFLVGAVLVGASLLGYIVVALATGPSHSDRLLWDVQCQVASREAGYVDYAIVSKDSHECVIMVSSGGRVVLVTE